MSDPSWIIVDDEIVPSGRPVVPAESRAVRYGEGCFETFKSYGGAFLKLSSHLDRLNRGMRYLRIETPEGLEELGIIPAVQSLLEKNGLAGGEAVVRIQVWRGGNRGYAVRGEGKGHYAITVSPPPDLPSATVLATVPVRRIPSASLDPTLKLSNGINYIRASAEARSRNADDALMQTVDGHVSETPIANIFWYAGGTVFTPSPDCDLLPGITRELVIDLVGNREGWTLEEGKYPLQRLRGAEACWICNSVREILPVRTIDETEFDPGHDVIRELKKRFNEIIASKLEK